MEAGTCACLAAVIDPDPIVAQLKASGTIHELQVSPSQSILVHVQTIHRIAERICGALANLHDEHPLRIDFPISLIEQRFEYLKFKAVFDAAVRNWSHRKAS